MTRQRYLELKPVMEAWAAGEQAQVRRFDGDAWTDCPDPEWHDRLQYRVKPKAREVWVVYANSGDGAPVVMPTALAADAYARHLSLPIIVHMREVTP